MTSFLLVGQSGEARENRSAAVQALLVTVFGGLVMLLGFVLLGEAAGTYRISEIVALGQAGALGGGTVTAALALILVGALTKSAQLPFHPWLPAAMAAPTPVSAYLHAASMVKAGVYLVARLSPGFADAPVWWVPVVVLGLATMAVGGWRAMAQYDLKRLLAFGTVSQLGFLMVLFGAGTRIAAIAGIAMLLAHGFFKAPLFLVDRHRRPRDRHPGRAQARPDCGRRCAAARSPPRGSRLDGRAAAAARLRRQGGRVRGVPRRGRPARPARHPRAGRGLGLHRRLQRPVPLGRVRAQARRRRHTGAPAGAAADLAGRALRARRARARHREPRGRRRRAELRRRLSGHLPGEAELPPRAVARPRPAAAGVRRRARARLRAAPRVEPGRPACRPRPARAVGPARLRARRRRHRARRDRRHRTAAGRLGPDLPHRHPRSPSSPCPARPCWSAARGRTSPSYHAPLQLPLAVLATLAALALVPGAPPVHRGAAGRGGRLRRRRPVHRRRCPRSRAGRVPRRDAVAGRVRVRPPPDARPVHPGAGSRRGSRYPRP